VNLKRRTFIGAASGLLLSSCGSPPPGRYTPADVALLKAQIEAEQASKGEGQYGPHVYPGYRGLAQLPWFDLDEAGALVCIDDSFARAIDVHCHLGMSVLFRPELDLLKRTDRVMYHLDSDSQQPGSPFDLDVYANGNFSEEDLDALQFNTVAQGLWGSQAARTQTIPNLLREMDAMRVEHALLLPIKLGLPFGDQLTQDWREAVNAAGATQRLHCGLSVHPRDKDPLEEMRRHAKSGHRIIKLHPTVQRFYPDDDALMTLYAEAEKLGLVVFFHGGRAGIEPESSHAYAMPRHYEAALAEFPNVQFILGHAGARDAQAMLELAVRYENAWIGIHGQSLTRLEELIQRTGGERLLFGTDWPFYHIGASLAKVLIATDTRRRASLRDAILRGNALKLFPELNLTA